MPFYEYQCNDCGHRLEVLQKISDDPLVYCPECNQAALKKLISAAAFRLKGTGWYETDFKNGNKPETKKGESKSGEGSGDSGNTSKKPDDGGTKTASTSDTASTKKPSAKSESNHNASA